MHQYILLTLARQCCLKGNYYINVSGKIYKTENNTGPMRRKITLVKIRKSPSANINQELQWLGNSLGLFGERDKDSSCFRVFITLVKNPDRAHPLSSDWIAERLSLSRGTVVHHLRKLMESGIVSREQRGYLLHEDNLLNTINVIERNMEAMFQELKAVAKDIDERMG
jgi:predicted transcriptional regulator